MLFILFSCFLFSCSSSARDDKKGNDTIVPAAHPTSEKSTPKIILVLDTTWGNANFTAQLLDYPDSTQDALLLIRNRKDTIRVDLYDAQSLLIPDARPILIFSRTEQGATAFVPLSDSVAVFAARTEGLSRPEAFFLYLRPGGKMAMTNEEPSDGTLTGQINYFGFFREKNLFMFHHSGVTESETGSDQFRSVCTVAVHGKKFVTEHCYDVLLGDEDLFGSRNSNNYREYYRKVYEKYVGKK